MTGRMKGTGAKSIRKKKAREKNGLALDQKFTDRSELRQREHSEVQIMAARKPSKKFVCILSASVWVTKQTGRRGTECGGFLCSDLHFQIY